MANILDSKFRRCTTCLKFKLVGKDKKTVATAEIISRGRGYAFELRTPGKAALGSRGFASEAFAFAALVEHIKPSGLQLVRVADEPSLLDREVAEARQSMHDASPTQSSKTEAFRRNGKQKPVEQIANIPTRGLARVSQEELAVLNAWSEEVPTFPTSSFNAMQLFRFLRLNDLEFAFANLTQAFDVLNRRGLLEDNRTVGKRGHFTPPAYSQPETRVKAESFSAKKILEANQLLSRTFGTGTTPAESQILETLARITTDPVGLFAAIKLDREKAEAIPFSEMKQQRKVASRAVNESLQVDATLF